tara:strand:+ start:163 stop:762 length:600 start_codon:yes stop_codon:yes gene_type:complete
METENSQNTLLNFLKANIKIFLYIISILILIITAIIWFTNNNKIKETKISDSFIKAQILIEKGKKNEAEKILSNLVLEKNSPYSSLSLFLIIENKLIVNKETIINYFDEVINNNSFKEEDLNLLRLKKAIYISDISMEQEILGLLKPIINSNSVWKNHALKFLGDFYYSNGQQLKAKEYYLILSENEGTPSTRSSGKID